MIPPDIYQEMLRVARIEAERERIANNEGVEFKMKRMDFHVKNMIAGAQPPKMNPGRGPVSKEEIENS